MSDDRPHAPVEASPALARAFCRGLGRPAERGEMLHFNSGPMAGQMWACTESGTPGRWRRMVEIIMDPPLEASLDGEQHFDIADVTGHHGGPMMEITIKPKR